MADRGIIPLDPHPLWIAPRYFDQSARFPHPRPESPTCSIDQILSSLQHPLPAEFEPAQQDSHPMATGITHLCLPLLAYCVSKYPYPLPDPADLPPLLEKPTSKQFAALNRVLRKVLGHGVPQSGLRSLPAQWIKALIRILPQMDLSPWIDSGGIKAMYYLDGLLWIAPVEEPSPPLQQRQLHATADLLRKLYPSAIRPLKRQASQGSA